MATVIGFDKKLIGGRVVSIFGTKGGYVSPVFIPAEIQAKLGPGFRLAVVQTRPAARKAAKRTTKARAKSTTR
jgi:hypothetical protein